jgi:hypothetical protein
MLVINKNYTGMRGQQNIKNAEVYV